MLMMMMTMKNVIPFFSPGTNAFISSFISAACTIYEFFSISILCSQRARVCVSVSYHRHQSCSSTWNRVILLRLFVPSSTLDRRRRRFGRREGFEFRCWVSNVHDILLFFLCISYFSMSTDSRFFFLFTSAAFGLFGRLFGLPLLVQFRFYWTNSIEMNLFCCA